MCAGPVAQLDRASPSEGEGRTFESCRVRQHVGIMFVFVGDAFPGMDCRRSMQADLAAMDTAPPFPARFETFADIVFFGWLGLLSTALTLSPFIAFLMPERMRNAIDRALPSTSQTRRNVLVIVGVAGLFYASFRAFDDLSSQLREAREIVKHTQGLLEGQQLERARNQHQLLLFFREASNLLIANVGDDRYEAWKAMQETLFASADNWVKDHLGLKAQAHLFDMSGFTSTDYPFIKNADHRARNIQLEKFSENLNDLIQDETWVVPAQPRPR